jgi:hypothetical protein
MADQRNSLFPKRLIALYRLLSLTIYHFWEFTPGTKPRDNQSKLTPYRHFKAATFNFQKNPPE